MERHTNHKASKLLAMLFLAILLTVQMFGQGAEGDPMKGKDLFKANCAACHKLDGKKLVGPPLDGVTQRRSTEWLHKWIKNSKSLIDAGDKDAVAVFEEYNKVPMLAYESILSDEDIDNVLAYVTDPAKAEAATPAPEAPAQEAVAQTETTTEQAPVAVADKGSSISLVLLIGSVVALLALVFVIIKPNRERRKLGKENKNE